MSNVDLSKAIAEGRRLIAQKPNIAQRDYSDDRLRFWRDDMGNWFENIGPAILDAAMQSMKSKTKLDSKIIQAAEMWLETHDYDGALSDDNGYTYGLVSGLFRLANLLQDELAQERESNSNNVAAADEEMKDLRADLALVKGHLSEVAGYDEEKRLRIIDLESELVQAKEYIKQESEGCETEILRWYEKYHALRAEIAGEIEDGLVYQEIVTEELPPKIFGQLVERDYALARLILSAIAQRVREGKVGG